MCDDHLVFVRHAEIHLLTFQFKILTRYYWRKSRRGIRLTKVNTKWSRIHSVDAAFEVPSEDVVYLFEGNVHGVLLGLNVEYSVSNVKLYG